MTPLPTWMRRALLATAAMNILATALFLPGADSLRAVAGFPLGGSPFYLVLATMFVLLFGLGYLFAGVTGRADRLFIAVAAVGKASFFALLVGFWAAGAVSWRAPLSGSADLFFAVLFFVWLRAAPDASVERRLTDLWERHIRLEFTDRDPDATVATMADENYVNHVPVMTGGRGRSEMLEFYGRHFIPKMPADTRITRVCRTVGQDRVVDEMIFAFTHDIEMDWMLPGVAPTGRPVAVPLVVVAQLAGDRIVSERIYWDQASVLAQLGLVDPTRLPVVGVEAARKTVDPTLPSNELIRRATR